MMTFIASMCIALPMSIFPPYIFHRLGFISRIRKEQMALRAGQFSARNLLRLIPFCTVEIIPHHNPTPEPSIWVCNHVSSLDIFMMLATDKKMRGKTKRPIKIVYVSGMIGSPSHMPFTVLTEKCDYILQWKQLEDNPVTKVFFQQCGFIPVQMTANKSGEANDYDMKSFKFLLKQCKQAFEEGFDIGILPEGQLNPHPEKGLLPSFSGAFTLARMSKRPINMMALHGTHKLWHAREDIGMTVTGRNVKVRCYPNGRKYKSGDEFLATFNAVVGKFGTHGKDIEEEELEKWLDGTKWEQL
jgi:1-acyl-sn-glycerol-3-phosphate acyltransferase